MTAKRIDLDAARKARAEKRGKTGDGPPVVVLGGREFTLPPALPALVVVGLARARRKDLDGLEDCFEALFGPDVDAALRLGLELDDLDLIIEDAYGDDPGEAPASES